jgi:hypothetical protein
MASARKMNEEDVRYAAQQLLYFIDLKNVTSFKGLESLLGEQTSVGIGVVRVEKRVVNEPANALYVLGYSQEGMGTPIELRVDAKERMTTCIVKMDERIKGYKTFSGDTKGNYVQSKKMSLHFRTLKQELQVLSSYGTIEE